MNRTERWVMLTIALVAGLTGGLVSGRFLVEPVTAQETTKRFKYIEAEAFRLVDRDGKQRAVLGAVEKGNERTGTLFGFLDASGKIRIVVGLEETGGPFLRFNDSSGKQRLYVGLRHDGVKETGEPVIMLLDGKEMDRIVLLNDDSHGPAMKLSGAGDNAIWLNITSGKPLLTFSNKDGTVAALDVQDIKALKQALMPQSGR